MRLKRVLVKQLVNAKPFARERRGGGTPSRRILTL